MEMRSSVKVDFSPTPSILNWRSRSLPSKLIGSKKRIIYHNEASKIAKDLIVIPSSQFCRLAFRTSLFIPLPQSNSPATLLSPSFLPPATSIVYSARLSWWYVKFLSAFVVLGSSRVGVQCRRSCFRLAMRFLALFWCWCGWKLIPPEAPRATTHLGPSCPIARPRPPRWTYSLLLIVGMLHGATFKTWFYCWMCVKSK